MNQEDNKGKGFQKLKKFLIDKFPELTKLKRKNRMEGRYDGIHQPKFTTFYYYDNEVWFIEYDDKDIFSSAKWDVNDKLETFWSLLNDDELFEKLIKDVCDIDLFDKWGKKYNWQFDDMSETLLPRNIRESIRSFLKEKNPKIGELTLLEKILKKTLSKKYNWFKDINLTQAGINRDKKYAYFNGKIFIDADWGGEQWREYHYSQPIPSSDEELSFGDIIGGDLSQELQDIFKTAVSMIGITNYPKYTSFSWLDTYLVEDTMKLDEQISRIQSMMGVISENLYSPSGDELTPNRLVVHVSNPVWRDNIKLTGLQVSVGDCYSSHVGDLIYDNRDLYTGCQPAIFATNSLNKKDRFDSTYDDDIWLINTECAGVKWYWDTHFEGGDYPHIVTFENISPDCIKLIHKGTGESN